MKMIAIPHAVSPCEVKIAIASDSETVSTGESPSSSIEKQASSSSLSFSSERDREASPSTPPRRSIFGTYWQKHSSSISFKDEDNGSEGSVQEREVKRSPKLEPSYLGIYSFAPPSPLLLGPKVPTLSPISSTDSLNHSPTRPKSILRRHRSLLPCHLSPEDDTPSDVTPSRPRSASCVGPESPTRLQFNVSPPHLVQDDTSEGSSPTNGSNIRESDLKRQHSFVHFDPTITVRECVGEDPMSHLESNWFSDDELRSFVAETVNLCHSSAVDAVRTYSLPAVKKAYDAAHEAGVKRPLLSSSTECRALFSDPVLHATDEDAVVHDGSKRFFKIMSREIQRVLIVDNSPTTLKLFRKNILSMFPHVQIDCVSGEDAIDKIEVDTKRPGLNYDLVIVEERLQQETQDLTGSELLRLTNEMETSQLFYRNDRIKQKGGTKPSKVLSRRSLKIGVSVSLGEDCESLRNKGGADVFWSKPPPKPSNGLRNQVLNALLSKRGNPIFICGC
mmetsp:Transcript_38747/g.81473  ORF Transcript_38747/g.81473 Transcript_38747/m.81473 type:complete len:504 (+) Transcript_38747:291-1802(+)|eukprot:CAMPEP_0183734342 /NCGR_PEP_ID=MMETSP0737-20130205/43578_1 /TAXON_ID=385413 /ORGANISM="Thalassiosira miniscula, Strain CCMP1093" /LENGTH=503 /DNA_ID=CAMNT_0025967807 /DNA_START=191 /DNA_END=1702 /DNA_ORIENTATION=-